MELDKEKLKRLEDKLKYLYKMELEQKKFVVSAIDIDFEQDQLETGEWILERVVIQVDFEYDGRLDGDDVYYFTRDLKIMCDKFTSALSQYTPTQEGKIVSGTSDNIVSDPMVIRVDYKYEDTHNFTLATYITFPR
jgi:hypothetical protein